MQWTGLHCFFLQQHPKLAFLQKNSYANASGSTFGMGGGYLKDLYTTYVAYQLAESIDGALSPPRLTFLHPGRPGMKVIGTGR